jgi:two-component system, LytTR family, sensor kinase
MKNPLISVRIAWYVYTAVWTVIVIVQTVFLVNNTGLNLTAALADALLFNFSFAIIGTVIWYPVRFIKSENTVRIIISQLSAAFVLILIWITVCTSLLNLFAFTNSDYQVFLDRSLSIRFFLGLLYYLIISLCCYLYIHYVNLQEKKLKESTLNEMLKETQLQLLKSQINPHFIFNSLNSVSSLTITNPQKANEMILKLSSFLRYAIQDRSNGMVSLEDEAANIRNYLEIEQIRFQNRLEFVFETGENCLNIQVPDLILQPVVENVIKHAVYESTEKIFLRISCRRLTDSCEIEIYNSTDPDAISVKGSGIGLKNVSRRLQAAYSQANLLKVDKGKDYFCVTISIPLV